MQPRPYAHLLIAPNPLCVLDKRELRTIDGPCRLADLAPKTPQPFIMLRNGQAVMRADWTGMVGANDLITVQLLPQGGGGGGSNPLKIVLTIAISYFTGPVGDWMTGLGAMGPFSPAEVLVSRVAGAAFGMVANAAVNALIPSNKPPSPNGGSQANYASASPTYNLTAQGNMARLDGPIPVQYGRMVSYPDFAAATYIEYAGNEQYLYQLLSLGVGEYDIESICIEDTPIANFEEITTEIVGPNETLDLFPAAVATSVEVSGQEANYNVTLGPFVAHAAGTVATRVAFDVVCPRGLYYANDAGGLDAKSITFTCEAQLIDDDGVAIGSWLLLGTETITAATTTPQRNSYSYVVTAGRYRARLTRTTTKDTSSRSGHELDWVGLRAYLVSDQTFGNVTLIAIKAKATNSLSAQASRKFRVISTRRLHSWSPATGWSATTVPTRSAAWAALDAAKLVGVPDDLIDLNGLNELDATLASRGDTFDARFDQIITFWDALQKIGKAVRSRPYQQGGIIFMRRYEAASVPVQIYTNRNMVRGSFEIEFMTPSDDTADAIEARYFDETVWKYRRVTGKVDGSTSARPAKADYFGVVQREQAYREALHEAAVNARCRIPFKFQTEMEGFIPAYLDLIAVAADLPAWGQSGEVVAWDAGTLTLTLSEPPEWSPGQTHYIGLRRRDGSNSGPYEVTAGAEADQVVLEVNPETDDPRFKFYIGQREERTHYAFGWGETWSQPARVLSARPLDMEHVEIIAINEDPLPHTIDQGVNAPAVVSSQLAGVQTAPTIAGLKAWSMPGSSEKMLLSWRPSPGATHYLVEQSCDGNSWTRTGEPTTSNYTGTALYGNATLVRVAAVGLTRGPWVTIGYGGFADYMWSATPSNLMWSATPTNLMWRY